MTSERFFALLGEVDEAKVAQAEAWKPVRPRWRKWAALAACLALVLGGTWAVHRSLPAGLSNGGGVTGGGIFGGGDSTLLPPHRKDFTPNPEPGAQSLGPEVLKLYRMQTNEWFLSQELIDFSQAVTTQVQYLLPGEQETGTGERGPGYDIYTLDGDGQLQHSGSAMVYQDTQLPRGLMGLTHGVIQEDIGDTPYDDYIVAVSHRLNTAFAWVRSAEGDFFLAYPSRPEFVGLENRGRYTLEELQDALTQQYWREQSGQEGTPNGGWPEGIDPIVASVAVFPGDQYTIYDVEDATITSLTQEEAYAFEPLGAYLPMELPEGYSFYNATLYETTMKDGTKFYMLRTGYSKGSQPDLPAVIDGETGESIVSGTGNEPFILFPMNYKPDVKGIFDAGKITVRDIEKKGGSVFHVSYGDIYMGISPYHYVSAEDFLTMIQANLK